VTLHVKGRDIFVEQSHEDLYAAIDQLMDKLDRQVVRHKDRLQDHHHQSPKRLGATWADAAGNREDGPRGRFACRCGRCCCSAAKRTFPSVPGVMDQGLAPGALL
jgi:hypothetical protein